MRGTILTCAALLLGGCTVAMWSSKGDQNLATDVWPPPWPPAHIEYEHIEAAAVCRDRLYFRIARSRGGPLVFAASLTGWARSPASPAGTIELAEDWSPVVAAVLVEDLPSSARPVLIVERGGIEGCIRAAHDRGGRPEDVSGVMIELSALHVLALDTSRNEVAWIGLPYPPLDWFSLNVIGHVVTTPLFVAVDVVMLPLYGFYALIRMLPGH